MIVYIITFAISLFGVRMADLWYEDKNQYWAYSLMAVLPPILIAGFRDTTVGSDVEMYLSVFNGLVSTGQNYFEFVDAYPLMEVGYLFLNWVIAQLTDQTFVLLLSIHVLIIIPLYVTAMKWREYLSPTLFMFIYYMIFFQESLSIARQSISLSLSMLGFTLFLEKKTFKYIVCLIVAFLFHQTTVIALSFPLVYYIVDRFSIKQTYIFYIVVAVALVLFFVNLESIIIWFVENGYIDLKFLKYTAEDNTFTPVLGAANFVVKIVTTAYLIYVLIMYKSDTLLKFFLVMAVLDMLFSLCALITQPLDRLSLYYRLMACISLAYLVFNHPIFYLDEETPYRAPAEGMVCLLLFAYWLYVYMLGDYDDTSNYQFSSTLFI